MKLLSAIVAALLASLIAAGPATAGVSIVEAGGSKFPERSYVLQVDPPVALGEGDVSVRENGGPVQGLEVSSAASSHSGEFASVLVIDASLSVKGEAIDEAMKAARAFAAHRAPRQRLGVIAFNGAQQVLLPLTTDEAEIAKALSIPPRLGGGTRLYDAVSAAITELERAGAGAGSVVVLTDGADTGSTASEDAVVRQAAAAGVRVFVVGLESGHVDLAALNGLARAGEYTSAADPSQLAPIFSRFGVQRASEHLIRYRSQATAGEKVAVEVHVDGVGGTAHASYAEPLAPAAMPDPSTASQSSAWDSAAAMITVGLLVAAIFAVAVFLIARPRREPVASRLARLGSFDSEPLAAVPAPSVSGESEGPLGVIERPLKDKERWRRFEEELDVAGIEIPAAEILVGTIAATLLAMILIAAVSPFGGLALFGLLIPLGVRTLVDRKVREARKTFADSLADNLQVVASAIRAGHSMIGALGVLVEEASEPAKEEFRRIVAAERVGVPLEEAIREVARRMENRDMEQLALVAIIQRETGGNTAEIIDRAVETIRERTELRRMMATLTAQGRLSRVVITALPVGLLLILSVLNPTYIAPLFETGGGQAMLLVAAIMVTIGSLVIKRIVEVRV